MTKRYIVVASAAGQPDGYWGPYETKIEAREAAEFWDARVVTCRIEEITSPDRPLGHARDV